MGYGYQEKYYELVVAKGFDLKGIAYRRQVSYRLTFKGEEIGKYRLDFLVENKIVLEIKKGDYFPKRNIEQIKGYLKATDMQLAILANFTSNDVKFLRILNI